MDPKELVLDLLATYRLTRLATADVISEPARQTIVNRLLGSAKKKPPVAAEDMTAQELIEAVDNPPKLATLVTCRWCAGMWIAGGVVLARAVAPKAWDPLAKALAFSAGAALLAGFED
jgi:hypothetical protein